MMRLRWKQANKFNETSSSYREDDDRTTKSGDTTLNLKQRVWGIRLLVYVVVLMTAMATVIGYSRVILTEEDLMGNSFPNKYIIHDDINYDLYPLREWPINLNSKILDDDPRPLLIMNVGIPKTGSTTLQHYLEIDEKSGLLGRSNYTYFACAKDGLAEQESLGSIWGSAGKRFISWKPFVDCLEKARASGKNAIYSYEIFGKLMHDDAEHWENLKRATKGFRVVIVVTYRRFFEWLPSYFFQNFRLFDRWSFGTPVFVPMTFPKFFEYCRHAGSLYKADWGTAMGTIHPTEITLNLFSKHFDDLILFNIHEASIETADGRKNNLVAEFYCNILPNAKDLCEYRLNVGLDENQNVGSSFNYALFAHAAFNQGLVNRGNRNARIVKVVRSHQENELGKQSYDFPMRCITRKEMDWFLYKSLLFEKRLIPTWYASSHGEIEHRAKFLEATEKKKFCTIDASKAIEDSDWQKFLYYNSEIGVEPKDESSEGGQ